MIYKLNNDGIVKLQNAGSVPEYGNIEQIAKYNREHGTNFYKMSQVLEHDKQQAQQKSQNKKKSFWEILAGHPESSGEAILNKTIETANNAELPETRSKIYNDTGKAQLATTAGSLLALPMLGEFSTYGLLGGASRLAGGFGGSAVGSYTLGKAGELGDRTFGTTWMKPAGQVIGGFAGWAPGSNIAYKGALDLASKVPSVARIGSTDRFIGDVAGREMSNLVRSFNVSKNPFYSNPTVISTIDHLYKEHPELATIGPKEAYGQYYKTIFPASKVQIPYAHGTRGNLSKGLEGSTKVSYTAAPETIGRNDFYLNLQPEASLQYADGIGVPEGFTWNKHRFWPLKEILGKPYKSDSWMFEPIQLRKQIPNRAGQFSRVKNIDGTYSGHGKLLEEYKAELGMQDLSDKEFLQRFGIKDGETFEQWVAENKQNFSDIYNSGNYHGLYHVKVDASNPLTINGGNTYYSERGIWDAMNAGKNDVLLHNNAANEFGSDVMVVKDVDPSKVRILGSDPDKQAFIDFMNGHNIPFTPISQKFVSTVHFDPRVKPLSRPISEAERLGLPKGQRNQTVKQSDNNSRELQRFLKEKSNIKQKSTLGYTLKEIEHIPEEYREIALRGRSNFAKEMSDKMRNYFDDTDKVKDFNKLLKDYVSQIESDIDPRIISTFKDGIEQPSIVVRGFRNYLRNAGVDASELSNEELAKILTQQYKTLSTEATGKLRDDILWHGSPEWFDSFDFSHTGENTGNGGALGPGNYFSLVAGPYGRTKSSIDYRMKLNNTQPYIITGIQSTPNGATMIEKGVLPEYIGPAELKTESGRAKLNDIIKSIPKNDNRAYIDLSERAAGSGADYKGPSAGVMIRRNTGIKSLYPHPSRFIRNSDGTVSLIPTNWSDVRVNFKQGGILKAQRGLKPFESATAKSYFSGLKDYLLHQTKSFTPSLYKPTKGSNIQQQYYTRPGLKEEVVLNLFGGTDSNAKGPLGKNYFYKDFDDAYNTLLLANESRTTSNGTLGRYGVSAGIDDKGRYISFIDNFDHVFIPGKGIPIYDRIYEDEIESLYNPNLSALNEGDWITRSPELKKISKHKLNKGGILKAQNGTGLAGIPILGNLAKKAAYKIVTNPDVAYAGGATPKTIVKSLFSKNQEDDNKKFFLYGVDRPQRNLGEAYNWQKDIDENGYKNVKSYEGVLNPYGEYLIDSKNKHLVEDNLGKDLLININSEYTDPSTGFISNSIPYFDDVHGYKLKFHKDENGNIVASTSDLYDFGKNYSDGFSNIFEERSGNKNGKRILEMERNALNAIGKPYILTNEYPVRFVDNPKGEELMRVRNLEGEILSNKKSGGILSAQKGTPGFVNPFTNQLAKFIVNSIPENPNPVKVIKRNQSVKVIKENQPVKVISTGNPVKVIKVNQPVTLIKETHRRDNRPKRLDDVSYKNHAKFVEHGGKTT